MHKFFCTFLIDVWRCSYSRWMCSINYPWLGAWPLRTFTLHLGHLVFNQPVPSLSTGCLFTRKESCNSKNTHFFFLVFWMTLCKLEKFPGWYIVRQSVVSQLIRKSREWLPFSFASSKILKMFGQIFPVEKSPESWRESYRKVWVKLVQTHLM